MIRFIGGARMGIGMAATVVLAALFSEAGEPVRRPAVTDPRVFGSSSAGGSTDLASRRPISLAQPRQQTSGADHAVDPSDSKQNEVSVAVNPRDPRMVLAVFHDYAVIKNLLLGPISYGNPRVVVYLSIDGGETFTRTAKFKPRRRSPWTADPSVAYDRKGRAYVAYLAGSRLREGSFRGGGLFVARSGDGGRSWEAPVLAVPGYEDGVCQSPDKPFIGVGPRPASAPNTGPGQSVYLSWQEHHLGGGDCNQGLTTVEIVRSSDGGRTFSRSTVIAPGREMAFGSMPRVSANGTVHVSYVRNGGGPSCGTGPLEVVLASSSDGGRSFTKEVVAQSCFTNGIGNGARGIAHSIPTLAISDERLAVAWIAGAGKNDDDIEVRVRDRTNGEWRSLPPLASGTESAALMSWIAYGPDGRLHVMYSAAGPGGITDTYLASSDALGTDWTVNEKVSTASSINQGGYSGFGFGHYQSLDVGSNGRAHILWVDRREIDAERAAGPTGRMMQIWIRSQKA